MTKKDFYDSIKNNLAELRKFFAEVYHIQLLRCKSTHFISDKHQNHQKIIQYADNLTIIHTIPHYFGCKTKERCKITSNLRTAQYGV